MHGIHAATSKVEKSAQGSSCKLKFVHAHIKQVKKCVHVCKDNAHVAEGAILIVNDLQISFFKFTTKNTSISTQLKGFTFLPDSVVFRRRRRVVETDDIVAFVDFVVRQVHVLVEEVKRVFEAKVDQAF